MRPLDQIATDLITLSFKLGRNGSMPRAHEVLAEFGDTMLDEIKRHGGLAQLAIKIGLAYEIEPPDSPIDEARESNLGLWDGDPIAPWEWRRRY